MTADLTLVGWLIAEGGRVGFAEALSPEIEEIARVQPRVYFPIRAHAGAAKFVLIAIRRLLELAPAAPALGEDAYVARRMTETLAEVYATIIGDDERQEDESLNAIERVKKAAQVLRLEVDLYRAQRDETAAPAQPVEQTRALTDEQIDRAIVAWFDDRGFEHDFSRRMRNAFRAAQPASGGE